MCEIYTFFTHHHNFAVWAAARASQRGLKNASVATLKSALEASKLHEHIQDQSKWPVSEEEFDKFHRKHCCKIMKHLETANNLGFSYGRAAKLVAVYLKSMIVLSRHSKSSFAKILHPPIDRILLRNLASDEHFDQQFRDHCRGVNWTQLKLGDYFKLIGKLRSLRLHEGGFWRIECYWDPTQKGA
jgi:hypothetical protein